MDGVPSVEVFLSDPSPYLREFWKKNHEKHWALRSTSMTEKWTWHLKSTNFWAQPLVELRTDSLTAMPNPGFDPGTFCVAAGFPNHFTAGRRDVILNLITHVRGFYENEIFTFFPVKSKD